MHLERFGWAIRTRRRDSKFISNSTLGSSRHIVDFSTNFLDVLTKISKWCLISFISKSPCISFLWPEHWIGGIKPHLLLPQERGAETGTLYRDSRRLPIHHIGISMNINLRWKMKGSVMICRVWTHCLSRNMVSVIINEIVFWDTGIVGNLCSPF